MIGIPETSSDHDVLVTLGNTWAILKVTRFDKNFCTFLYFRKLVLNKILPPDIFDYGGSKSESWHRAKKNSRSISCQQIAPLTFLRN